MSQEVTSAGEQEILRQLELINERLGAIERGQQALRTLVHDKLTARTKSMKEAPSRIELTPKQLTVFQEIDKIEGADETARSRVQEQLSVLESDPLTEALVDNLKYLLKQREWGIECPTCKEPSSPMWKGQNVQFTHSGYSGKQQGLRSVTHGGMSKFQKIFLVARSDKRIHRNK